MNATLNRLARVIVGFTSSLCLVLVTLTQPCFATPYGRGGEKPVSNRVKVDLSEWMVKLTPAGVPPGPVIFEVSNTGTIAHAFELEGVGLEERTPQVMPGATATLKLNLRAGRYEAYCPVGKGSHKMLGMRNHLMVGSVRAASAGGDEPMENVKVMRVTGGGPVIQILPGPFPFADSAMAVIRNRPADQQADLTHKAHMGPYSNNVAVTTGDISLVAIDRGASGDSVSGVAEFTAQDGARWKAVMDRVQTKDIPFNPRFGGVIMGLFYHGASGVHTPLVPTIQSSLALWAFAHLYKNGQLVTNEAMVHVMLLSRTRSTSDWALDCWECSDRPIEELQLQLTPAPGAPPFDAPGGFLFVNWEKSSGQSSSL